MSTKNHCRHCNAPLEVTLADLGKTPVANDYVARTASASDPRYPLKVLVCSSCRLAQTADVLPADALFRADYAYFSSHAASWVDHARRYVSAMTERFDLQPGARHVELASNDGYLLQFSRDKGLNVLGVEPCLSVAEAARAKNIETRVEFFGKDYACQLAADGWTADLVTANNVYAHVPDINDFTAGIRKILRPQGVATIEVQHLLQMMSKLEFDTIYHEHFSYLSLLAAKRIFEAAGLRVFDVEELPTHGGSLRFYLCRQEAKHVETPAVERLLAKEIEFGLDRDETYAGWAQRVEALRDEFKGVLTDLKVRGMRVAAYGAPAKACTLLNYCGVGPDLVEFTVDRAQSKQGRFIPGVRIPIFSPEALEGKDIDGLLILPWNLRTEIQKQLAMARVKVGFMVVAIPWPEILPFV